MNPRRRFLVALAGCLVFYLAYGVMRFRLGVDFTDEGAYLAWPLRVVFGEKYFAGDPLLLLRPLFALTAWVYRIAPGITLVEFRLLGWLLHLAAFATLANYLFRRSQAVAQSLLLASVPLFACHLFGLAVPSYNSVSSDFLLIALCLYGLSRGQTDLEAPRGCAIGAGLALFFATFAHPGLGLVAAAITLRELGSGKLLTRLRQRQLTASNLVVVILAACWIVALFGFFGSGAVGEWWHRLPLAQPRARETLHDHPLRFYPVLLAYPFFYSRLASITTAVLVVVAALAVIGMRTKKTRLAASAATALAVLLDASLIATFSYEPDYLPAGLARVALLVGLLSWIQPAPGGRDEDDRFALLLALLAALSYATLTYYFSPLRSWASGVLGLPFIVAVGLARLLPRASPATALPRLVSAASLLLLVACLGREHYRDIYRDGAPADLDATFQLPKLRGVRSTAERVDAVEALYATLRPRLARGEPLLAFDDCPLLYFIFDARPVYGLTWAVRYTQRPEALAQHDAELRAGPLPHFAIRTLVDLSHPVWRDAPRTVYADYPLNATVLDRYVLTETIFPFEIWELNPARPHEKASPGKSSP